MQNRRIASTLLDGLIAHGRSEQRDFGRLSEFLAAHFPGGLAIRFAEPVPSRDGKRVDWYLSSDTRPPALESLTPEEQAEVSAAVGRVLASVQAEGERLAAAGDERGTQLIVAAQTPTPLSHYVYLDENRVPVLTGWGYGHDWQHLRGAAPEIRVPTPGLGASTATMASAPVVPSHWGWRWWWPLWLLLTLLLLAIGWNLLQACAIAWPTTDLRYCRHGALALAAEVETGRRLEADANRLQLELIKHETACLASRPPPAPTDRWVDKNLAVLEGCWTLGRDTQTLIVNDLGKQERCTVHAGTICFKGDGTGTREVTTDCGTQRFSVCRAPVKARFNDDGALETEQPETKCQPQTITWHAAPNRLICKRVEEGGALCRDGDNFDYEFKPKAP